MKFSPGIHIGFSVKQRHDHFMEFMQRRCASQNSQFRILLIGTEKSGKSTFMKQAMIVSRRSKTLDIAYRRKFLVDIYYNILKGIICILDTMKARQIRLAQQEFELDSQHLYDLFTKASDLSVLRSYCKKPKSSKCILFFNWLRNIWSDYNVQSTWRSQMTQLHLSDSTMAFLHRLEEITQSAFVASDHDVLLVQALGKKIYTETIVYDSISCHFVDASGDVGQRARWSEVLADDHCNAVFYFVDVSAFDKCQPDDAGGAGDNEITESVRLLDTVWNKITMRNKSVIVFLNKYDLLEKKVRQDPTKLEAYFPLYLKRREVVLIRWLRDYANLRRKSKKSRDIFWVKQISMLYPFSYTSEDFLMEFRRIRSSCRMAFRDTKMQSIVKSSHKYAFAIKAIQKNVAYQNLVEKLMPIPLFRVILFTSYLTDLFIHICCQNDRKPIYVFPIIALDQASIQQAFRECMSIIQNESFVP